MIVSGQIADDCLGQLQTVLTRHHSVKVWMFSI
jgi:hypothetical protein